MSRSSAFRFLLVAFGVVFVVGALLLGGFAASQVFTQLLPARPTPTRAQIFGITIDPDAKDGALVVSAYCGNATVYLLDQENKRGPVFYAQTRRIDGFGDAAIFSHLPVGNYEVEACNGTTKTTVFPGTLVESHR